MVTVWVAEIPLGRDPAEAAGQRRRARAGFAGRRAPGRCRRLGGGRAGCQPAEAGRARSFANAVTSSSAQGQPACRRSLARRPEKARRAAT